MSFLKSRSRMILIVFAVTAVNFAVVADTNAVVATAEKCPPVASVNVVTMAPVGDTAFDRAVRAELKAAVNDAKEEYKDRYEELKTAHDRFMLQLNISLWVISGLVALLGVVVPLLSVWREKKMMKEVRNLKRRLGELLKSDSQFQRMQAKHSSSTMKLEWVKFLHIVQSGNAKDRDIVLPLYRTVETLVLANKLGDTQFLDECVKDAAHSVSVYGEALKDKSDLDKSFKDFVREKSICTDSINFNYLAETLGGKTPSLKAVLKFMNEFGITMFGEVDG